MSRPRIANPDEILAAAAALFATRPFHEVRLDDVAAAAEVGKGTLYLYWHSKEDLYLAIIRQGFSQAVQRVDAHLAAEKGDSLSRLAAIIDSLVDFAFTYPDVYRIMRSGILTPEDPELQRLRATLVDRIVRVLKQGVKAGEIDDPCPALTAQYVLSFVRGALLYPPQGLTPRSLKAHLQRVLTRGIARRNA